MNDNVFLFLANIVGSGFVSKRSYGSGFFHLRMKLPPKDSSGVVTSFYVSNSGYYIVIL